MPKAEQDLLVKLDEMFQLAIEHPVARSFASNAKKDFEFREGKQWTSDEEKELLLRGQAPVVENETKPVVDRVIGQYKRLKTRIGYRGRNLQDEEVNNSLSDIALYIQQNNSYEFEEGDMVDDGVVCGFGVIEAFASFDDVLQPEVRLESDDSLDFFPDPQSKQYDWNKDARFLCRAKWLPIKKAEELYPKKKKELRNYVNENPASDVATQDFKHENYVDHKSKRVRIVETWYKKYSLRRIIMYVEQVDDGQGQIINRSKIEDITEWSKKQENALLKSHPEANVLEKVEIRMHVGIFCKNALIEHKETPYDHNLFPFVPYYVYRKKDGEPYGMVRPIIWQQTEINKRRSKALHQLTTSQTVFEKGAIQNKDELAKQVARPDGQIEYVAGKQFELIKNTDLATTQMALLQESKQSISRTSNVSDEARGLSTEVRSGIGIQRKQMMTDLLMMPIFANLRRTRQMIGRLIFELIKQYYTEEKAFNVTDDMGGVKAVQLTKETIGKIKTMNMDTVIEEMPDTTTIQDEQFQLVTNLLQGMKLPPQYAMALLPIMIRLSQLRGKDEILKMIEEMSDPGPEKPSINLNLVWDKLSPAEKAKFAETMGFEDLAQAELQEDELQQEALREE